MARTLLAGCIVLVLVPAALAQPTYTWSGASSSLWNNAANWTVSGGAPNPPTTGSATTVMNFTGASANLVPNQNIATFTLNRLNLGGPNYTLTTTSGGLTFAGTTPGIFVTNGNQALASSYNASAPISLGGAGTEINIAAGAQLNVNGRMTGAATKTGAGILNLVGQSGLMSVSCVGGTTFVRANNGSATDSTGLSMNGGTANFVLGGIHTAGVFVDTGGGTIDCGSGVTLSGQIQGPGVVVLTGLADLTSIVANTHGGTTVRNGTLFLGDLGNSLLGTSSGTLTLDNGNVLFNGASSLLMSRPIDVQAGNGAFRVSGSPLSSSQISGTITGAGRLTLEDLGNVVLSGTNSHGGTTLVNGTLNVSSDANLGAASAALRLGAATLSITGSSFTSSRPIEMTSTSGGIIQAGGTTTLSGVISGNRLNRVQSFGTLTLSGANTFTAPTLELLATGSSVIAVNSDASFGQPSNNLSLSGNLRITGTGFASTTRALALTGTSSLEVADAAHSITLNGVVSGSQNLSKTGPGRLVLAGNNTFTGTLSVLGGSLEASANNNLGNAANSVTLNGGALRITGTSFTASSRAVALGSSNGTMDIASASNTFAQNAEVSGSGNLTKSGAGTLVLNAANSYSGSTTVLGGTLRAGSAGAFGSSSQFTLANAGGVALDLNGFSQNLTTLSGGGGSGGNLLLGSATATLGSTGLSSTFDGRVIGSGNLVKAGAGVLTLGGTVSHAGTTQIQAGTLRLTGSMTSGGIVTLQDGTTLDAQTSVQRRIVGLGTTSILEASTTDVRLGLASDFAGFNHQGELRIGTNAVTLESASNAYLGSVTTLDGGSLDAPNGLVLRSESALAGRGRVTGRVLGFLGSVIHATGDLAVGDETSPAGFVTAGELRVGEHQVVLGSSSTARLGVLTSLGNGGTPGQLRTANGAFVDFTGSIGGYGTIESANLLSKRVTINGVAQGLSAAQPLTFTGWVKGVGLFENVVFTGTFDPGLSPALIQAGDLTFTASSSLLLELGGLDRGSEYDAIDSSGLVALAGGLGVTYIDGFNADVGDVFVVMRRAAGSGQFTGLGEGATFTVGGDAFAISYQGLNYATGGLASGADGNDVVLTAIAAVPEPATWALFGGVAGAAWWLRRWRRQQVDLAEPSEETEE